MNGNDGRIQFTFEEISAEDCKRLLDEHDEAVKSDEIMNRGRKPNAIQRYSTDLKLDTWYPDTGETLKFETFDKQLHGKHLIDGQNRLAAAVDAEKPLRVYVARGVAREAFAYIDGGEKRSLADILKISGYDDSRQLAMTLSWLCRWDLQQRRLVTKGKPSTQRARKLLESDPKIRKSLTRVKQEIASAEKRTGAKGSLMSVSMATFLHRVFSRQDEALADEFIRAITSGAGLATDDPFLMLRAKLTDNKGSTRKIPADHIVGMAVKTWNAKRKGVGLKTLTYKKQEVMPSLEEMATEPDEEVTTIASSSLIQPVAVQ